MKSEFQGDLGAQKISKDELHVDCLEMDSINLTAIPYLQSAHSNATYKQIEGRRPPLGIYTVSVSRTLTKTIQLAKAIEQYFLQVKDASTHHKSSGIVMDLLEKMEACIYAAAEHVDDFDAILKSFSLIGNVKQNQDLITVAKQRQKSSRRLISHCVNAIKHNQSRLGVSVLEIKHGGNGFILPGVFIEAAIGDSIVPDPKLIKSGAPIISISSVVWDVLMFIGNSSAYLAAYLKAIGISQIFSESEQGNYFADAVIAAARLPLYSFDEAHPFSKTRLFLLNSIQAEEKLDSKLYGSKTTPWSDSKLMAFGEMSISYKGDGITKTFGFPSPKTVSLRRWGVGNV